MLGIRIQRYRSKKKLSLSELARRAGLSKSLISQIERGEANPTIESVRAIASALEVPVFLLVLDEDESHSALVRKGERVALIMPDSDTVRELLTPDVDGASTVLISRIAPGSKSSPSPVSHEGEEWVFVLQGALLVHLQDESILLEEGDFLRFDPHLPHLFSNHDDQEAHILCAIAPARFPPLS